jgi:hypothetical protein
MEEEQRPIKLIDSASFLRTFLANVGDESRTDISA